MIEVNDLKAILAKHCPSMSIADMDIVGSPDWECLQALKAAVNLTVDVCKKRVSLTDFATEFLQEGASEAIDTDSLEQIKYKKPTYQVKGRISGSDEVKTIIVEDVYTSNEAMDYAAMFHSIDEIEFIKQGELVKGIFKAN